MQGNGPKGSGHGTGALPPGQAVERELGVLPRGTGLGIYQVVSLLGQGAFGITYRARDPRLHRDVAIKEYMPVALALRDGVTVEPRSRELESEFHWGRDRFIDEARTLARLENAPAVVRVIDFLEANGTAYMVMPLLEGETLAHRLQHGGPLSPAEIARLLPPLLDGLERVHAAGFLHRDIKPSNIVLDEAGQPTLIDFGAARAAVAGGSTALTAIFTPGYAAIEQFTAARQGPPTDIYGLAATLYHAISGAPPPSAVDRVLDDACRPLRQLAPPGFDAGLLEAVDAGLAVRADARPRDIAAWRRLLEASRVEARMPTELMPRPARRRRQSPAPGPETIDLLRRVRRSRWLWPAGAGLALLLAGGAYVLLAPGDAGMAGRRVASLTADQLEQALAERRQADALAAEKQRLEEEARAKAAADAEAKRRADADLEAARQRRLQAEAELARIKAEMETQSKVEAERRAEAAAAAERAQQEAIAQKKAQAEIAALRQAAEDARAREAARVEAERQASEQAQRKAADEAAARRQAEDQAQAKAAAEAESKRQADAALARAEAERRQADDAALARRQAEEQAQSQAQAKAAADVELKRQADEAAARRTAESAESGLRLATADRQRLQVALSALGFDTRGTDGVFGPRSREMISAWQKARGLPATGFIVAAEQQRLLQEAAAAVSKFDDGQKRLEEEKKKAEDEARRKADDAKAKPQPQPLPQPDPARPAGTASPPAPAGPFDGRYRGTMFAQLGDTQRIPIEVQVTVVGGHGSGTIDHKYCSGGDTTVDIAASGQVTGRFNLQDQSCKRREEKVQGRVDGNRLVLNVTGNERSGGAHFTMDRQ